jgi:DNA-directed RNA polymerase subunit RPC12/RpoP
MFGKESTKVCISCGKENPDRFDSAMPDGRYISEFLTESQKKDVYEYVLCQDCKHKWNPSNITQKTILQWKCPYCSLVNNEGIAFCEKCNAPRK